MHYIILDLEFNQPFDFPTGKKTVLKPSCPFEIIQIGAVKLTEELEMTEQANFLIKPQIYKRIHPYVEKMTSLTMRILNKERTFDDVFSELLKFIGNETSVFGVWGSGDIAALFRNALYYCLNTRFLTKKYINVQSLTSAYLQMPSDKSIGLRNAVEKLGINTELPFHDALNDAIYTAMIFRLVHKGGIKAETFNLSLLRQQTMAIEMSADRNALFRFAEKELGRKLNDSERETVLKIYNAGQNRDFSIAVKQ